ncbi:hypothetical protein ACFPVX_00145 [Cohnella faecalis]|uniref:Uncharacterized protein n=1 Tax=Cohnella faecalis TaxID=2315694 RepID=A0A398CTH6_9BACL|nr:hypothetical protein [Cohnella faecalis]RIE02264.1 hypothetical protein D3H35_16160 [Cohnella faecalis]
MKARYVYLATAALVVAGWLGNYFFYRSGQLPEGAFLRHYIETADLPGATFNLFYAANNRDKRKIVDVRIEELPGLRFYPPSTRASLRHQTIYSLIGHFDIPSSEQDRREDGEPLKIRSVDVRFNDGTMRREEIGEIIVYREKYLQEAGDEAPFEFTSSKGSTDHSGSNSGHATRPAVLTGVTSSWLKRLGPALRIEIKTAGEPTFRPADAGVPLKLDAGDTLSIQYRFDLSASPEVNAMDVYNVLLRPKFKEADGRQSEKIIFANYDPYPTEAEMRSFVRAKREEAP